jgi:DNA-binding response OmpR family regulator
MSTARPPAKKRQTSSSYTSKDPATPETPSRPPFREVRRDGVSPKLLHCGVFTLDQRTLSATKREHQLRLTPMQAKLLLLFMRHPGRVIRRKTIVKEIWDTDYTKDTRMLDVHICGLRKVIEDDPRHPAYLRTVRGVGYRFGVPGEDTSPAL